MIFVALDFSSASAATSMVERLGPDCRAYKIGLELLTSAGPDLARRLASDGCEVFLDLKLFEIPNSVAGAVRAAGDLGASMVSVHAMGGPGILSAAVSAAAAFPALRVVALTVVTSMTADDLRAVGVDAPVEDQVVRLARLAVDTGCEGVVVAPGDVAVLRAALGPGPRFHAGPGSPGGHGAEPGFRTGLDAEPGLRAGRDAGPMIVTPGIRLRGESGGEHARAADPASAVRAGATHLVVGRSLSLAPDPGAVLRDITRDIG